MLVNNTLSIEILVQALTEYVEARAEHDRQRDAYTGYSWGYHGRHLVDDMERSASIFQEKLEAYIDKRIKKALSEASND